ncbi:ECF RNA polymerase sigma factor SigH [Planctomycetes bacterium Poly30]|uniref:ECF RNA polymerase sigma factor SigH n=1 Tax=Saltatorellus ferox TaxID=2528018 RepID=A0A518F143_9BACT|nr:ECF RNA polymerase sigma factor SigH [Planctomycetes bacterium Poly30]
MHAPTRTTHTQDRTPIDSSSDHELVRRALAGDHDAREELGQYLDRIRHTVRACDRRMGGRLTPDQLEDVAQEAQLAVWSKLPRFERGRSLGGWIHGFAVRQHLRAVRTRARNGAVTPLEEHELAQAGPVAVPMGVSPLLKRGLATLPRPESSVIQQHHFPGRTFREIASFSGTPYGTVKTRYYRGLRRLQSWLVAQDPELRLASANPDGTRSPRHRMRFREHSQDPRPRRCAELQ